LRTRAGPAPDRRRFHRERRERRNARDLGSDRRDARDRPCRPDIQNFSGRRSKGCPCRAARRCWRPTHNQVPHRSGVSCHDRHRQLRQVGHIASHRRCGRIPTRRRRPRKRRTPPHQRWVNRLRPCPHNSTQARNRNHPKRPDNGRPPDVAEGSCPPAPADRNARAYRPNPRGNRDRCCTKRVAPRAQGETDPWG